MSRVLHVMNGHSICPIFEGANLPGVMTVYADPLHEGPVPSGLSDQQMREVRARFLSSASEPWEEIEKHLREWDATLEAFHRHDEIVLWFEHDLFDQLLLIRHLAWLARQSRGSTRLSLICIGVYPGIQPFMGLGQLEPDQFASLFETRADVTGEQLDLGRRAWEAFTSPDPRELAHLLATDMSALPFLGPALRRYLLEFPATGTGLPRTEHEILTLLVNSPQSPAALFRSVHLRETCFFIGDTSFRWRLDELASLPQPLIALQVDSNDKILPPGIVTMTDVGRDVLAGRRDWLAVRDFDRWLGGVHLRSGSIWRWNPDAGHIEKA
jgi:hypothetical protein